jgi:hypothetical protein
MRQTQPQSVPLSSLRMRIQHAPTAVQALLLTPEPSLPGGSGVSDRGDTTRDPGRATLLRERFIVLVPTVWRLFGHNSDSIFGCPRRSRLINCAGEWLLLSNCRRDQ